MARDYRAEYQARKARAASSGETVYGRRNRAATNLGYRSYGDRQKALRTGQGLRAVDVARRVSSADRRQVIPTPAGTVIRTTAGGKGYGVIESRIRNAKPGAQVTVTATVKMRDGTQRDVNVFSRGGWSAAKIAAALDYADLYDFLDDAIGDLYDAYAGGAIVSVSVVIT